MTLGELPLHEPPRERVSRHRRPIRGPTHVFELLGPRLGPLDREVFVALALDVKLRQLAELDLALGGEICPRDVFTALVRERAEAVIFVHNHPSGDATPSEQDHDLTRRLRDAGTRVGIRVVDHVIVAQGGFHSFAESQWTAGSPPA